jgi:hypothetical protein
MSLKVMNQLGLRTTRPYRNVCAMDSREIKVCGLIKDLHVKLVVYPNISILMDVVVIDVLDAWCMLLSRKWAASLGGSIQMDLSYATIPTCEGTFVTLYREHPRKYHVEDPNEWMNEVGLHRRDEFENYAILAHSLDLEIKEESEVKSKKNWKMHFDGAQSRSGVLFLPLLGVMPQVLPIGLSLIPRTMWKNMKLFFDWSKLVRDMGIKVLEVIGDSDLVVMQVKDKFVVMNDMLKGYKCAV